MNENIFTVYIDSEHFTYETDYKDLMHILIDHNIQHEFTLWYRPGLQFKIWSEQQIFNHLRHPDSGKLYLKLKVNSNQLKFITQEIIPYMKLTFGQKKINLI